MGLQRTLQSTDSTGLVASTSTKIFSWDHHPQRVSKSKKLNTQFLTKVWVCLKRSEIPPKMPNKSSNNMFTVNVWTISWSFPFDFSGAWTVDRPGPHPKFVPELWHPPSTRWCHRHPRQPGGSRYWRRPVNSRAVHVDTQLHIPYLMVKKRGLKCWCSILSYIIQWGPWPSLQFPKDI